MPVKTCTVNGKSGYKWGDKGKCYTGPNSRQKALEQGRAIEANKSKSTRMDELIRELDNVIGTKK